MMQPSWILPCWLQTLPSRIQTPCYLLPASLKNNLTPLKLNGSHLEFYHLGFSHFVQIKLHSFILIQLDEHSHLEFCHVGFRHYHLWFRHLVIFSQIHFKTLSLHSDSDSNWFNLTQTHSVSFNLMMAAILNSAILNSAILNSAIIVFPLKLTHTCQDWFPPFAQKNFTHSFWLNLMMQPSWILPCWIQTLPSRIQTPCYLLSDSLKNCLTPLCLRFKLIQSD